MNARRATVILVLLALVLVPVGLYLYLGSEATTPNVPGSSEPVEFLVPKGAVLKRLQKPLAEARLIHDSPLAWRLFLTTHSPPAPKAGKHLLNRGMSMEEVVKTLAGTPLPNDVEVTVLEGWRLIDTDKYLAESEPPLAEPGTYVSAAKSPSQFKIPFTVTAATLEGYLYPETYRVPLDGKLDVHRLIQRQIDFFAEKFSTPFDSEIKKSSRSLHDIVTVASLLEREERRTADQDKRDKKECTRCIIAGIIYKRLDSHTPLGIDATSRYELVDWNDRARFLEKLKDKTNAYNSRERSGLPPTPIGAASLDSLIAALRPKSSSYWYYLHENGNVHFAKDAKEHEANRAKYNVY
jgi:UPF0755 protein